MRCKRSLSPNITVTVFKDIIHMKYKTEKYIASKNNTHKKFQAMQMEIISL